MTILRTAKQIILWLTLAFACFLPAPALTPTAPENHAWKIFSIGYDAAFTEVTDLGNRTETSTSNYDTAPIRSGATEKIPTEANRSLFGPNAELKAAEATPRIPVALGEDMSSAEGVTVWRNVPEGHGALGDATEGIVQPFGEAPDLPLETLAEGHDAGFTNGSGLTSWTADLRWAQARQARLGGVVIETQAPAGSVWFNQAAKGAESQILIPGKVSGTVLPP
jgi:hypothetical protein